VSKFYQNTFVDLTPELNSYSYIIRDGMLARLKELPTFQNVKKFGTTKMQRIQVDQLPFVAVYFIRERTTPDGDPNAGDPRFIYETRLGYQVFVQSNDETVAEKALDAASVVIMNILRRQDWHRFETPAQPPDDIVEIEGILGGERVFRFGNTSITNETPVAELQMDQTYRFRAGFPPIVTDDLRRIHVQVVPWPYDPASIEPPFNIQYDLPIQGELTVNDYTVLGLYWQKPTLTILP